MILSRSSTRISPKGHSWKRTALPTTPSISISHPVSTFRWSMKKSAQKWNPVSKIRASIRSKSEINSCFMDTFLSIQSVSVTRQEQHIVSGIGLNSQTPSRRLFYLMHIGWLNKSSFGDNQTGNAIVFLILFTVSETKPRSMMNIGQEGTVRYLVYRVWLFGRNLRSFQEFRWFLSLFCVSIWVAWTISLKWHWIYTLR